MTRQWMRNAGTLTMALLLSVGAVSTCLAKEKTTIGDGTLACNNWCGSHYRTMASKILCSKQCDHYWYCNGADSTPQSCAAHPATAHVPEGNPVLGGDPITHKAPTKPFASGSSAEYILMFQALRERLSLRSESPLSQERL